MVRCNQCQQENCQGCENSLASLISQMGEMNLQSQNVKNILLLGRTGSGKSTLGNVLINKNNNFTEVFKESAGSISETKQVQIQELTMNITRDGSEKIRYLVIDTAGFGDTQLTEKEVLKLLQELAVIVGNEGINRIFFVTNSRFTAEEIEVYKLLESVLFDKEVNKHTTIIRTKFPEFTNEEKCEEDRRRLKEESRELFDILGSAKIIYVDNPPLVGRYAEVAKETREESRQRLLTYLGTCQETYKPTNLGTLKQRVDEFMTKTERLKKEVQEKKKVIEEEKKRLQKEIDELRTRQQNELENNRRNFDQQIQNAQNNYNQQLQNTKNQLQSNYQTQISSSQQRFNNELNEASARHQREIEDIRRNYGYVEVFAGFICPQGHRDNRYYPDVNFVECSICPRRIYMASDCSIILRKIRLEDYVRISGEAHNERMIQLQQQIQDQEQRNRQIIENLRQERNNRDIAFQQELNQQRQLQEQLLSQQRADNEASFNQQRQNRESQINSNASSQETNLRNQSSQQVQSWEARIQQAEQGRSDVLGVFSQYIRGLLGK